MTKLDNSIEIELEGRTFKLKPTLKAAEAVSMQFDGFLGAYRAIGAASLQVTQFLVKVGTDNKDVHGDKISTNDLNELVWLTGVPVLADKLTRYVQLLQNGGKTPEEVEAAAARTAEGESSGNE